MELMSAIGNVLKEVTASACSAHRTSRQCAAKRNAVMIRITAAKIIARTSQACDLAMKSSLLLPGMRK
jgi:hypothetical protein